MVTPVGFGVAVGGFVGRSRGGIWAMLDRKGVSGFQWIGGSDAGRIGLRDTGS